MRLRLGLSCILIASLVSCAAPSEPRSATVAVAANFKTTLDALEADFEADSDFEIDIVVGSTGKLYAQIVHGAPFDVFLAADQARPARLVREGHAAAEPHFTYAIGRLAVVGVQDPAELVSAEVANIAIANPDLAPYGKGAEQVLAALGLAETVTPKLVLGENVGQAFAFTETGNAQAGFVSEAQLLSLTDDKYRPVWRPTQDLHDPIAQDAVLLTRAAEKPAAIAFLSYLRSDAARDIIAAHGYDLP